MMAEPMRMCLGCRTHAAKAELCRVVRTPSGEIRLDPTDKLPGRGAYLCKKSACVRKVQKTRALERALKTAFEPAVYEELIAFLEAGNG